MFPSKTLIIFDIIKTPSLSWNYFVLFLVVLGIEPRASCLQASALSQPSPSIYCSRWCENGGVIRLLRPDASGLCQQCAWNSLFPSCSCVRFFVLFSFFWDRIFLHSLGCPGPCSVNQLALNSWRFTCLYHTPHLHVSWDLVLGSGLFLWFCPFWCLSYSLQWLSSLVLMDRGHTPSSQYC